MNEVNAYLAALNPEQRAELERIRAIIKTTAPDAVEGITYGLPGYKYSGQPLIYYGAFKSHLSLFPTSSPIGELRDKLKDYKGGRGTIQFTLDKPLPESLIIEILETRLKHIRNNT